MAKQEKIRHFLPVLNRRDALYSIASCGLAATALSGCVVSTIYGELTDTELIFDVADPEYAALQEPSNAIPIDAGGWKLVLIRTSADEIVCLDRICPHEGAEMSPLQEGLYDAETKQLICTRHRSIFDIDGEFVVGLAMASIRSFPVEFDPATGRGKITISLVETAPDGSGGEPSSSQDSGQGTAP
ncbi:MAG: Rieske (2Fe-2S) protein [Myxococcota bacterium]|nr:Rieske (2Fe-2S) protein [Myxococcota bacterium]